MTTAVRSDARRLAESVLDPEMPMLTLADLGVLRDVEE
ncbi:phenylacetate-CoA oxygenase subunit PaaJ, partial [Rhodococcus koreensis]